MDINPLEFLKLLWFVCEVVNYFVTRKREKTLIASLESYNQRLIQLENKRKEIP